MMAFRSLFKVSTSKLTRNFSSSIRPNVECVFEPDTNTCCYIVSCPETGSASVIDSVLNFDSIALKTTTEHADQVISKLKNQNLDLKYIMETHVHADHLTGARVIKKAFPQAVTAIGSNITLVQSTFAKIFNIDIACDGSQFDKLIHDGEEFSIGKLHLKAINSQGHTPACMVYIIGDSVFTGDTLFMPDFGTARCDFPNGSASTLYDSIMKIYSLPEEYRVFVGHDYGPGGREYKWETTIGESKYNNAQLNKNTKKEDFVKWRESRDANLKLPRLITQSLQVNLRNGALPEPESNGVVYFKTPINTL